MNFWPAILIPVLTIEVALRIFGLFQRRKATSDKRPFGTLKKDHYIVLCEGASFTRGLGAPEGYDYPSQLESLLNATTTGKRFIVINKAISAQNTAMILLRLSANIDTVQPDLVILLAGVANFWNNWGYGSYRKKSNPVLILLNNIVYRIRIFKLIRLYFYERDRKRVSSDAHERMPNATDEYFDEEIRYFRNLKKLTKKVLEDPRNSKYYFEIGNHCRNNGHVKTAQKWFQEGININPRDTWNYIGMAFSETRQGKFQHAVRWLQKAIIINPRDQKVYLCLAQTYMLEEQNENAVKCLLEAARIGPLDPESTMLEKEKAFFRSGDIRRLIENYEHCTFGEKLKDPLMANFKKMLQGHEQNINKGAKLLKYLKDGLKRSTFIISRVRQLNKKRSNIKNMRWVESDLTKMVKICNDKNVAVVLQNYPISKIVNEAIRKGAQKTSCIFVENEQIFNGLLKEGFRREKLFAPDGHCTAKGYAIMAGNLFNAIVKARVFPEISQAVSVNSDPLVQKM